MKTYEFELTIEVTDVPMRSLGGLADDLARVGVPAEKVLIDGFHGTVTAPADATSDQIRQFVVDQVANHHFGKASRVAYWNLLPATEGSDPR